MEDNIYKLLNKIETDTSIYEEHDLSEHEKKRLKEGLHRKIGASGEKKVKGNRHIKAAAIAAICVLVGGGIATALILGNEKKDENIKEEYVQNATILDKEDVTVQEEISSRREEEFTDVSGDITIRVDIELPEEVEKMPLVQVETREISEADIEKWEEVFSDGNEITAKDSLGQYHTQYHAKDDDGNDTVINVNNRDEADFKVFSIDFYYNNGQEILDGQPNKSVSEEETRIIADELLEKLGMEDDWTYYTSYFHEGYDNSGKKRDIYFVRYIPCVNEIPILPLSVPYLTNNEGQGRMYHSMLEIEMINGIVMSAVLETPLVKKDVINDDAKKVNAEEAYNFFKEQAPEYFSKEKVCDTEYPMYSSSVGFVKIDGLREGLVRIKDSDNEGAYLLVPAWIFYGCTVWGDAGMDFPETFNDSGPMIAINAIDGSIIDSIIGY